MAHFALHSGEHLKEIYHQTEIVLSKTVLIVLAALYIPWFLALKYDLFVQYRRLLLFWTLVVLVYAIREYMIWTFNKYIITSERLVVLSHVGLFKRVVIETPLERILNISYKTTGFWSSLFRYGDVEVQVVGLIEPLILRNIKQPREIKDYLWQLHQQQASQHSQYNNEEIAHIQEKAGYTKNNQKVL
jgi:hypothetical protein